MKKQCSAPTDVGVKITRKQRRSLTRNAKFKEEASRILRIDFTEAIDPDTLYEGIIESFKRNTGEIHITLTKDGYSDTLFTGMPLDSAYGLMRDYAKEWVKGFTEEVEREIAHKTLSPEELAAEKEAKIAALKKAKEEESAKTLEYLHSLRAKITDHDQRQRWIGELDAMISELENAKTGTDGISEKCA